MRAILVWVFGCKVGNDFLWSWAHLIQYLHTVMTKMKRRESERDEEEEEKTD